MKWIYRSLLQYFPFMKLFDREYQIPIFPPYDIAVFDSEAVEHLRIKIFVVLRMGMTTNEISDVNNLNGVVVEI